MAGLAKVAVLVAGLALASGAASFPADEGAVLPSIATPEGPPNVIVILVDDMGIGDLSGTGNTAIHTPVLDGLLDSGVRFSQGYTTGAVCSPSRAGLMTGRYQQRFGFHHNAMSPRYAAQLADHTGGIVRDIPEDKQDAQSWGGLPPEEVTLAERLKEAGYATALFGKWHLGMKPGLLPTDQGFDTFIGILRGASLFAEKDDPNVVNAPLEWEQSDLYLWDRLRYTLQRNGEPAADRAYMTDVLADEAVAYIRQERDKPFFIYLAFNAPHNPLQAPKDIYDELGHIEEHHIRVYYAMIVALDRAVGRVLEALEQTGIADNTIVFFSSDNGAANYHGVPLSNAPFRGWKATYFEGGIRVPFVIRWPAGGVVNRQIDWPASQMDLTPTILAAAGLPPVTDGSIDGINLLPFLADGTAPERPLFWQSGHYRVVYDGRYKLKMTDFPERVWLFDITADPLERRDLAAQMPDEVARLKALWADHAKGLADPAWPSPLLRPIHPDWPGGVDIPEGAEYIMWPG